MKKTIYTSIFSAIILTASLNANAQILDNTFDSDGKVITAIGSSEDIGRAVAIQADGKIIVVGQSNNGSNNDFAIVRYNTDGSLDDSFDGDGKSTLDFTGGNDTARAVALQSDGKIVVAGSTGNSSGSDFALVRYNTDGSLDNTFDFDGKVSTPIETKMEEAYSVAIQSNGKIVVSGYYITQIFSNNGNFAVVRYNEDGSLDKTFGVDGIVKTELGNDGDRAYSMGIQSDGKIVVAGSSGMLTALVRYNSDGTLDNTFDTDGKIIAAIGSSNDAANSLVLQNDGKIVISGNTSNGSTLDFFIARYNSDGTLDGTFGTGGKTMTDFGAHEYVGTMALQRDGKFVVVGSTGYFVFDFALLRYNSDGTLDASFDSDGKIKMSVGTGNEGATGVAIQKDAKIVMAGFVRNSTDNDFAVVRYSKTITNINEEEFEKNVHVYPNPSSSKLNILTSKEELVNASVNLRNLTGEIFMKQENVSGSSFVLDISEQENGLYFLEIIQGENVTRVKLVKN